MPWRRLLGCLPTGKVYLAQESGLIHFQCTAPTHQQGADRTADTLTVHEGRWSYCPRGVREKDHVWAPTGGIQIELLRRGSPMIDLDLDVRPHVGAKPASTPAGSASPTAGNGAPRKRATKR